MDIETPIAVAPGQNVQTACCHLPQSQDALCIYPVSGTTSLLHRGQRSGTREAEAAKFKACFAVVLTRTPRAPILQAAQVQGGLRGQLCSHAGQRAQDG